MTLQVPFSEFAASADRLAKGKEIYLCRQSGRTLLTAAHNELVLVATTHRSMEDVRRLLTASKATVLEGRWAFDGELFDELEAESRAYVGAVAYATPEGRPGLWVDAFENAPTDLQVLQAMFAEMTTNGEVEMNFETFIKVANASVAVVGPDELSHYVQQKRTS
jgi:hypothetical protein